MIPDPEILELARFMHDRYEHHASHNGWKTNKKCRVEFDDLPPANKSTMLFVAQDIIRFIHHHHDL